MKTPATPHTLFIADLHLCESRPATTRLLLEFLAQTAIHAEALYILGDLFEYWLGDDTLEQVLHQSVALALQALANTGVKIYFMHGNRDFLIANEFAQASHSVLLAEPAVITLYGTPTLLMHGDTLCTDDVDYLAFRQQVRNPAWQSQFLAQPLAARTAMAQQARNQSELAKQEKTAAIMDVNAFAVAETLRQYDYPRLIHGHTHRPAGHQISLDGHPCQRWVLPDWYVQGGYLRCDAQGCELVKLS